MHAQLEVWKATCTTPSSPLMWNQETELEVSQQNVEMSSDGKFYFFHYNEQIPPQNLGPIPEPNL